MNREYDKKTLRGIRHSNLTLFSFLFAWCVFGCRVACMRWHTPTGTDLFQLIQI